MVSADGLIQIEVTDDGMLQAASFENSGTVRLIADAALAAGVYTPIEVAGAWDGTGSYEAFGGVWDETMHTFTVASAAQADDGQLVDLDLSVTQRLNVGGDVSMQFNSAGASGTLQITASATEGTVLADLEALLPTDEMVSSSWDFDVAGLADGETVQLSFAITGTADADDLTIWHYDEATGWTLFDASDLVLAGGFASFTVDGFSSYAVTVVPEPATMSLVGIGGFALLRRKRRCA
jgi:hypothetical protein